MQVCKFECKSASVSYVYSVYVYSVVVTPVCSVCPASMLLCLIILCLLLSAPILLEIVCPVVRTFEAVL